ncbi:MAG: NYN domain-containing protein [Anaerolineales bacterium]
MPLLIDGHNLIGQTPGLRLEDPDDEQKLIALLRAYLVRVDKKGTVIFDRGLPGGAGKWSNNVLEVRFAPAPRTADELILERLRRARNPREVTVVTGDRELAFAARRMGAGVKASAELAREMLAPPVIPKKKKEAGLSPAEVEAWEAEFKSRRPK